ncbi:hypothetical protein TL16_g11837 [Triparma laevis f. inornata]|uniref:Arginase n=1 Tax=Triparma laevis f. inornata TaxID=1714386 RepID=A0A9W7BMK6_9STRA|nr:hypothetical protein TL16_g11837 [Triparma laevis f. inornata]
MTRRGLRTSCVLSNAASGGSGLGNVKDQILPSVHDDEDVRSPSFRTLREPRTVSLIPCPMTFGQPFTAADAKGPPQHALEPRLARGPCARSVGKEGRFPLTLGGDHSISLGSLAGVLRSRPNTGVIWVDAHADLNTPWISESGNMHGMPVGLLMEGMVPEGKSVGEIEGLNWLSEDWKGEDGWPAYTNGEKPPTLQPSSIVYVGLRDVDKEEREAIKSLNIKYYSMYDIDRLGIGTVMEKSVEHLLKDDPDRPLHLSYDIDAVDPGQAPATGTTVRGGLTYREAHFVAERIANSGNLASADLVELNPTLSDETGAEETVDLGLQILTSMMGKSII